MNEFAIKYSRGWYYVIARPPIGRSPDVGRFESLDGALKCIETATGAPVILQVLHLKVLHA